MLKRCLTICLVYMFLGSCTQKENKNPCEGFINREFSGNAVIFFHEPISGSTYQIFLVPICDMDTLTPLSKLFMSNKMAIGVSFNITSDDERFKLIRDKSQSSFLQARDHLGQNFRYIYYSMVTTKVVLSTSNNELDEKDEMDFILESGTKIKFKYNFVSSLRLKHFEVNVSE